MIFELFIKGENNSELAITTSHNLGMDFIENVIYSKYGKIDLKKIHYNNQCQLKTQRFTIDDLDYIRRSEKFKFHTCFNLTVEKNALSPFFHEEIKVIYEKEFSISKYKLFWLYLKNKIFKEEIKKEKIIQFITINVQLNEKWILEAWEYFGFLEYFSVQNGIDFMKMKLKENQKEIKNDFN
jgi:hypothetical protein